MTLLDWLKLPREQWKPAAAAFNDSPELETAVEIEKQIKALECERDTTFPTRVGMNRKGWIYGGLILNCGHYVLPDKCVACFGEMEKSLAEAKKERDKLLQLVNIVELERDKEELAKDELSAQLSEARGERDEAREALHEISDATNHEFTPVEEYENALKRVSRSLDKGIRSMLPKSALAGEKDGEGKRD